MSDTPRSYAYGDVTIVTNQIRIYCKEGYLRLDTLSFHKENPAGPMWYKTKGEPVVLTTTQLCEALKESYDNSLRNGG